MKKTKKTDGSKKNYPDSSLFLNSWPIYNRTIHLHETDKNGIAHFSNYFKIAEEALYSGLKRLGFSFGDFEYSISVLNTFANYHQPISVADHINVIITGIKTQQEKLIFTFNFNNSDHACLAEIQMTFVIIETKKRKPIPIPEYLKIKINQTIAEKNTENAISTTQIYT